MDNVTLGQLIRVMETAPIGYVVFADGGAPDIERSYRGYYSDLAFSSTPNPPPLSLFLDRCKRAVGSIYRGYKGGNNVMHGHTPLWRAEYGALGEAIVNVEIEGTDVVLYCKEDPL